MIIKSINIISFGKFSGKTIDFEKGVNIIAMDCNICENSIEIDSEVQIIL